MTMAEGKERTVSWAGGKDRKRAKKAGRRERDRMRAARDAKRWPIGEGKGNDDHGRN